MDKFTPHHAIFGEHTLISMEGKKHLRNRRYASPPFHGKALKGHEDAMVRLTEKALAALDIISEVVFGVTDEHRSRRVHDASVESVMTTRVAVQTAWATARGGKWTGNYEAITNTRLRVEALVQEEIDERRRRGHDGKLDVLGVMRSS
jgi:cytochrome P450